MSDAIDVMLRISAISDELDELSKNFGTSEEELEPVQKEYEDVVGNFEAGLWRKHEEGGKFPPEKLRLRLAHAAMDAELLGSFTRLHAARKRFEKRISTLKAELDAQRSLLSTLKMEAEASGAGLRRPA